jgi:O-antigen ligase
MSRCSSVSSKSTPQVYGRRLGPLLLPLVLVGGVAFDNGGYDATTWGWATLLPLVVIGLLLVSGRGRRPGSLGLGFLAVLAALVAWTAISVAWSLAVSQSVLEAERGLVYLAAAAAFLAFEREDVESLLLGLVAAIAIVCVWALCLRAFGGAGSYDVDSVGPGATRRLAEPLGYSNGLGAFAAIGAVVTGALAASKRNAAFAAPLLLFLPTLYFTYSRGAWLALTAGALAGLALAAPRLSRRLVIAVAAAVAVAFVVALVRVGGPAAAVREFSGAGPTVKSGARGRLLSLSGSSRAQYWHVAWHEYESHPLGGVGAGGFQRSWLRLRPAPLPVLDAHSLYLETLAELGPLGLALLVAALALPVVAGVRARGDPLAAAAVGGYAVFVVHAAQDWDWELPAVTLAGLVCCCGLLLLAERGRPSLGRRERVAGTAAAAALGLVALAALAGNESVAGARSALDRDDSAAAARDARWAERLLPWSSVGARLRGETYLSEGDVDRARRSFEQATRTDGRDWEAWADLALVTRGEARGHALARARELNPLGSTEG